MDPLCEKLSDIEDNECLSCEVSQSFFSMFIINFF